jgi:hypothetical protein
MEMTQRGRNGAIRVKGWLKSIFRLFLVSQGATSDSVAAFKSTNSASTRS